MFDSDLDLRMDQLDHPFKNSPLFAAGLDDNHPVLKPTSSFQIPIENEWKKQVEDLFRPKVDVQEDLGLQKPETITSTTQLEKAPAFILDLNSSKPEPAAFPLGMNQCCCKWTWGAAKFPNLFKLVHKAAKPDSEDPSALTKIDKGKRFSKKNDSGKISTFLSIRIVRLRKTEIFLNKRKFLSLTLPQV